MVHQLFYHLYIPIQLRGALSLMPMAVKSTKSSIDTKSLNLSLTGTTLYHIAMTQVMKQHNIIGELLGKYSLGVVRTGGHKAQPGQSGHGFQDCLHIICAKAVLLLMLSKYQR
jgi:hypothetical protein